MTDHFALLDQPRSPWLDPEQLKQAFHSRTLQVHPDAQHDRIEKNDVAFAQLNEAYQVLRDPKRRLQHLLALSGETPAGKSAAIPVEIEELFSAVASLSRRADAVVQKNSAATASLTLSLLKPEIFDTRAAIRAMLERLQELHEHATDELRELGQRPAESSAANAPELERLYHHFSYLTRWMSELKEKQLQLALR